MPVVKAHFGYLQNNLPVDRVALTHHPSGFCVEVLEYGARLSVVRVPDRHGVPRNTVLAYSTLREYETDEAQLGATVGRCANRTVALDHPRFPLVCNDGMNHLHGGRVGFSRSLWRTVSCADGEMPRVRLERHSPDGEEGYGGNVSVRMELTIVAPLSFQTTVEATTDKVTPLNVTLHPYFNLSGDPQSPIDDHELKLASSRFLPLGPNHVPTGQILSVNGTPFDFRKPTRIGARIDQDHSQLRIASGYDHYWPIDDNTATAAELFSPKSGICLRMRTNQKGIQFYAGNSLGSHAPRAFHARAGLCLEPQGFPNAINEPAFPSVLLHPGETYRHTTTYAFSVAHALLR